MVSPELDIGTPEPGGRRALYIQDIMVNEYVCLQ